jgi:hypothetical protein
MGQVKVVTYNSHKIYVHSCGQFTLTHNFMYYNVLVWPQNFVVTVLVIFNSERMTIVQFSLMFSIRLHLKSPIIS